MKRRTTHSVDRSGSRGSGPNPPAETDAPQTSSAQDALLRDLDDRRRQLQDALSLRMRDVRNSEHDTSRAVAGEEWMAPGSVDSDIELRLMQIGADSLRQVEESLRRLKNGLYGCCRDCDGPINSARLRALPFALRCTNCQEQQEQRNRP